MASNFPFGDMETLVRRVRTSYHRILRKCIHFCLRIHLIVSAFYSSYSTVQKFVTFIDFGDIFPAIKQKAVNYSFEMCNIEVGANALLNTFRVFQGLQNSIANFCDVGKI